MGSEVSVVQGVQVEGSSNPAGVQIEGPPKSVVEGVALAGSPAQEPAAQEPAGQAQPEILGVSPEAADQPEAAPETAPEPEEPPLLDFGGRMVRAYDDNIKGLHTDFQNQTRKIQEQAQQIQAQTQALQQMYQYMQALTAQQQQAMQQPAQQTQQAQPTLSPEELQRRNEELYNKLMESPAEVIEQIRREIREEIRSAEISPVMQKLMEFERQQRLNYEAAQLHAKYPDAREMQPLMTQLVQQFPAVLDMPGGLEILYSMAKVQSMQGQPSPEPLTPERALADPEFRRQILENEEVRKAVLSEHVRQVKTEAEKTPTLIGGQPAGSPPTTPPAQPKTFREATKAFLQSIGASS